MPVDRVAHYLRQNEANRYPRRVVCLDSEALIDLTPRRERHRFRCAVATFDRLDPETLETTDSDVAEFTDPRELWAWVHAKGHRSERTVLWAHNLGYDLRLTAALELLPELGYDLKGFSLDSYRCWARFMKGRRSLTLQDSVSFLPASLAALLPGVGRVKRPLPDPDTPLSEWLRRCRSDAEGLQLVVLRLLRYLHSEDMGSLRLTGPAQASAAFRHRFLRPGQLLVHDQTEALADERRSAYAGRCELWRHGEVAGYLYEWDYRLAYAHTAAAVTVPVQLRGKILRVRPRELAILRERYRVLCEVDVTTEAPVVPSSLDGRIVWPSGRFRSWLWDCELAELERAGGSFEVRHAWFYDRGPALREWAHWIIGALDGPEQVRDPIVQTLLKGWSRSLIGRFGLRYPDWQQVARSADPDTRYLPFVDGQTGESGWYVQVGRELLEQTGERESPDSMPAVMACVMAEARVRLWRAMQAVGPEHLYYVDTDSLLVDGAGHRILGQLSLEDEHRGLRFKRRHHGVELIAPRVILTDSEHRIAGLPKTAERRSRRTYVAEVWESPKRAVRRGRPSEVVVERRTYRIVAVDRRRRHLKGGLTAPILLDGAESDSPGSDD